MNTNMNTDNTLNIHELENIRVNIMSDVLALKGHLGKLKKKFKEEIENRASIGKRSTRWIFLVAPEGAESVQIAQLVVFAVPK